MADAQPQIELLVRRRYVCGEVESWARERAIGPLIGLDEAGRGPLAGPVVAAACALPDPCPIAGLDDSKALSETKREALYDEIVAKSLAYGVAVVERRVIDAINIVQASLLGMAVAWDQLLEARPDLERALVLVDGNMRAPLRRGIEQRPLVKGDARSHNIAAASILAKVTRDRMMVDYDVAWPGYGFARHKGYPTRAHKDAIALLGPCPIHRRTFNLGAVRA